MKWILATIIVCVLSCTKPVETRDLSILFHTNDASLRKVYITCNGKTDSSVSIAPDAQARVWFNGKDVGTDFSVKVPNTKGNFYTITWCQGSALVAMKTDSFYNDTAKYFTTNYTVK